MSIQQAIVFSVDYAVMMYTSMVLFSGRARSEEGILLQAVMLGVSNIVLVLHIFTVK
jgi:hypothetical protein